MDESKRMAGEYEIFASITIGAVEIVMGENLRGEPDERYMCAFCSFNGIAESFEGIMVSDDYLEILELYGDRIGNEADKLRRSLTANLAMVEDNTPVTRYGYEPLTDEDNLNNKVIVIKPDELKREYRMATQQYYLCTGGFGASPYSRGSSVFCTSLHDGERCRFERYQVLGTVEEADLPNWARDGLRKIEQHKDREAR